METELKDYLYPGKKKKKNFYTYLGVKKLHF